MSESALVQSILRELGNDPRWRIWRQNTGAAITHTGALVRFGVPGQADIMGLMLPHGRLVAIEAKSPNGRQSDRQRKFQAMIERFGGIYILARTVDDVRDALARD